MRGAADAEAARAATSVTGLHTLGSSRTIFLFWYWILNTNSFARTRVFTTCDGVYTACPHRIPWAHESTCNRNQAYTPQAMLYTAAGRVDEQQLIAAPQL